MNAVINKLQLRPALLALTLLLVFAPAGTYAQEPLDNAVVLDTESTTIEDVGPAPEPLVEAETAPVVTEEASPAAPPVPTPRFGTTGTVELRVTGVERPYRDSRRIPTSPSDEFVAIQYRLTNVGPNIEHFNALNFIAVTADDARWGASLGVRKSPDIGLGNLNPGTSVLGWVVYVVPKGNPVTSVIWNSAVATL